MRVFAHAKINLGLHILRRREDGYHDIETVFHRVVPADEIILSRMGRGIELTTDDRDLPTDRRNLCVAATEAFIEMFGCEGGVRIELKKSVPSGAGLGGGSSDAAAVLRALPALLDAPASEMELFSIGAALGSDVPYFLRGGSALGKGRGEILRHFDLLIPRWIALVTPACKVSTAWAYGNLTVDQTSPGIDTAAVSACMRNEPRRLIYLLRNDLEPAVFAAFPEIRSIKEKMYEMDADFSLMSGSGSSVYGIFSDPEQALKCADYFSRNCVSSVTPPFFNPLPTATYQDLTA
jgi:4-diphosphocytidyl-2-C-methyl-D-erythritol kinase